MRPTRSPASLFPAAALAAALALALALAACGPASETRTGFRSAKPIYSNAVLDLTRLTGQWTQVAAFTAAAKPACTAGGARIGRKPDGTLDILARLCLDGQPLDLNTPLAITGPGRLRPRAKAPAPLDRDWWLLWADTDLRTLVIGTPDGSFGFVLNRGAPLGPDRLTAAKQVLAFNGYDLTRLSVW